MEKELLTPEDFRFITTIGKGYFSTVYLVEKKSNSKYFAMKKIKKEFIIKENCVEKVKTEKIINQGFSHPFLIELNYTFQTNQHLYLVFEFAQGGDLFFHLSKSKHNRFKEERARFYAAQIFLALDYLHSKNIIYSDLKPENILLDKHGHVLLADFGLSKIIDESYENSFSGTPIYLSPEVILNHNLSIRKHYKKKTDINKKSYPKSSDWWAFGVLIYEMLCKIIIFLLNYMLVLIVGFNPFDLCLKQTKDQLIENIFIKKLYVPTESQIPGVSKEARDFIKKLLNKNPKKRLGTKDSNDIRNHPFFQSNSYFPEIDFDKLYKKFIKPPWKPTLKSDKDLRYFDLEYFSQKAGNIQSTQKSRRSMLRFSQINMFGSFNYKNPQASVHRPSMCFDRSLDGFQTGFDINESFNFSNDLDDDDKEEGEEDFDYDYNEEIDKNIYKTINREKMRKALNKQRNLLFSENKKVEDVDNEDEEEKEEKEINDEKLIEKNEKSEEEEKKSEEEEELKNEEEEEKKEKIEEKEKHDEEELKNEEEEEEKEEEDEKKEEKKEKRKTYNFSRFSVKKPAVSFANPGSLLKIDSTLFKKLKNSLTSSFSENVYEKKIEEQVEYIKKLEEFILKIKEEKNEFEKQNLNLKSLISQLNSDISNLKEILPITSIKLKKNKNFIEENKKLKDKIMQLERIEKEEKNKNESLLKELEELQNKFTNKEKENINKSNELKFKDENMKLKNENNSPKKEIENIQYNYANVKKENIQKIDNNCKIC